MSQSNKEEYVREPVGASKDREGFATTKSNSFDNPLEFLKRVEQEKGDLANRSPVAPPIKEEDENKN